VNRTDAGSTYLFLARAQWEAQTTARLGETATCGLRIDSTLDGADATVRVVSAFLAVPANPVRLTVYLVEDGITGVAQAGVDGPYVHDHVVRGFLTAVTGDAIAAGPIETGVAYASEFAFVVPEAWAAGNVSVVALVNEFDSDPAALDAKRVLNVQSGPLGSCTTW
jgi:hypothetical protein